jgi:hypothetical protein
MLVRISMAVSLLLLAFTVACTQAPPTPPDTHDADLQALKDTEAAWSKGMAAKDFGGVKSFV